MNQHNEEDTNPIDWEDIANQHKGKWVALEDDEATVITSAPTAKEALELSRKLGFTNPILMQMPTTLIPYIGYCEVQI